MCELPAPLYEILWKNGNAVRIKSYFDRGCHSVTLFHTLPKLNQLNQQTLLHYPLNHESRVFHSPES